MLVAAVILPSQLPYPHNSVDCIVNIKQFTKFQYRIFYACLRLRFLDVETNPGPRRPVPAVRRLLCSNLLGPAGNLSDLTVASSRYDCCALRLWSQICKTCRSFSFPDLVALSYCDRAGCLGLEGWRNTYEMDIEHFANTSLSVIIAKC